MGAFVNRVAELEQLDRWWTDPPARLALVWGRRRVGKTAILQRFAADRRSVFHTAGTRALDQELRILSAALASQVPVGYRDLTRRPLADWDDLFEVLERIDGEPLLLVLDEFPELVRLSPELPGIIRAVLDRSPETMRLKLVLCGSAVRTMEALQEHREPLYGRVDLSLQVHPFAPHECAALLDRLSPADRALVWGIVDGIPMYLSWWDQAATVRDNLARLACHPSGRLLVEGQLVLATEAEHGTLAGQVLSAIAAGRTRYHEINDAVRTDAARTLDRLVRLRLIERVVPVTEDPHRTRRRIYRVADNFLAFWLGILEPYRSEIERGLGDSILPLVLDRLDEHMGPRWEEAFRRHLRRLAAGGLLGRGVVAVGPYWREGADPSEIDAVVLAGRSRTAILAGEAKWAQRVDGRRIRRALERKALSLPDRDEELRYAVAARDRVEHAEDVLAVTAADVFG